MGPQKRYDFANYVDYVQRQWKNKPLPPPPGHAEAPVNRCTAAARGTRKEERVRLRRLLPDGVRSRCRRRRPRQRLRSRRCLTLPKARSRPGSRNGSRACRSHRNSPASTSIPMPRKPPSRRTSRARPARPGAKARFPEAGRIRRPRSPSRRSTRRSKSSASGSSNASRRKTGNSSSCTPTQSARRRRPSSAWPRASRPPNVDKMEAFDFQQQRSAAGGAAAARAPQGRQGSPAQILQARG